MTSLTGLITGGVVSTDGVEAEITGIIAITIMNILIKCLSRFVQHFNWNLGEGGKYNTNPQTSFVLYQKKVLEKCAFWGNFLMKVLYCKSGNFRGTFIFALFMLNLATAKIKTCKIKHAKF